MMKNRTKLIGMLVVAALVLGQAGHIHAADANPPERMTYQGYLVDGNGVPLGNSAPANYDVIFRIYKAKSGGEPVWAEQQTVTVDKGYFSVLLGEGSSSGNEPRSEQISTAFVGADISDRFIGITVGGLGGVDLEIAPRLRLVASPYAFTATQARNVSDGSGNRNLFREVDNSNNASLKLGAGSTPTLTLQEAGDATLAGKLTIDLPGAGVGLEIKEQGTSTKFGGLVGNRFSMSTARGGFHFDKSIYVDGDIYSFNRDARLYPSDNTDNFLNVNHDGDTIDAYTDKFYVRDHGVSYLEIDPTSSALNLSTDAARFYMNRALETAGVLVANGGYVNLYGNSPTMQYYDSDGEDYWIHVNGDRMYFIHGTESGWHSDRPLTINKNKIGINKTTPSHALDVAGDIAASGSLTVNGSVTASTITGTGRDMFLQGNAPTFYMQDSDDKDYMIHLNGDRLYFLRGEGAWNSWDSTRPMTIYQGNKVGINHTSPADELHIVHDTNGSYSKGLRIQRAGGQYWAIGTDYAGDLVFGYNQGDSGTYKGFISRGGGTWQASSDRRLKKDIEGSEDVLSKVYQLKPVSYRFNEQDDDARKSFGLIAQDVQKLFPYLVEDEKDYLALDYGNFGVLSIKAIQELGREKDAEVASLEKKNKQLESRVQSLESEMSLLKTQLANSTTQEDRIAKLEELVSKSG